MIRRYRRPVLVFAATTLIAIAAVAGLAVKGSHHASAQQLIAAKLASRDLRLESQGTANGGQGGESAELLAAMQQFDNARTAPGNAVAPGGVFGRLRQPAESLRHRRLVERADAASRTTPTTPTTATTTPTPAAASGHVTGRITGLAADDAGDVYAARRRRRRLALVDRRRQLDADRRRAAVASPRATSSSTRTARSGTRPARRTPAARATSAPASIAWPTRPPAASHAGDRVGGNELESTTINAIRFAATKVWVATLARRLVARRAPATLGPPWTLAFAPNPSYLPGGADAGDHERGRTRTSSTTSRSTRRTRTTSSPRVGWRSGDTYNGFYESTDGGDHLDEDQPDGRPIDANDIGNVTFACSADGTKLYVDQPVAAAAEQAGGTVNSYLDGIYVSNNGSLAGPWTKIADSHKLGQLRLGAQAGDRRQGLQPGRPGLVQPVPRGRPGERRTTSYAGLEEVYETTNGGSSWTTVGPYWNFYFPCWAPTPCTRRTARRTAAR